MPTQLFLASFLTLFLELTLIRYVPSQIRYVGFFSNIVLLASFVGIGIGTAYWQYLKKLNFIFFPIVLLLFLWLVLSLKYDLVVTSKEVVYFNQGFGLFKGEPVFLLPIIFFFISFIFLFPSVLIGNLLTKLPPLKSYAVNIGGSIAGIAVFTIISFLSLGPTAWFILIFFITYLMLMREVPLKTLLPIYLLVFLLIGGEYFDLAPIKFGDSIVYPKVVWSPYYKISLYKFKESSLDTYIINVNNIGHQEIVKPTEGFYNFPYVLFPKNSFKNVLVIGAGAGNDVERALMEGAEKVVAVEIDPKILKIGRTYNSLKPYDDKRVRTIIADGRTYLSTTSEKFDLIIFALTDSLTLTSPAASLRLESYLFTKESFRDAQSRLNPNGLLVLYNYYRSTWIVDKLGLLLKNTFDRDPYIFSQDTPVGPGAILIGAREQIELPKGNYSIKENTIPIPEDNWPFLYMKDKEIPWFYISYMLVIIAGTVTAVVLLSRKTKSKFDITMFLLGAAFMLMETKNIVQFSLLFGSTWLTNSFVFIGLLSLVLFAIWITNKRNLPLNILYFVLFVCIAVNLFFPQRELLNLSYLPRLLVAIIINFLPVFVANLIFTKLFKRSKAVTMSYGSNALGSFFGGILEYTSLAFGYSILILLVGIFYFISLILTLRKSG